ncbi:glutathione-regulated potassium-efflux system protein KefB [bacterium]|nr:glutathione-regulated potassium-efflux system protein KefB [bacterium]
MATPVVADSMLLDAVIYLGAAVVAVPVARFLGLGAVIGYLAAGVVIGPWGLGLISEVESTLHFAEIGVVLLLFIIGLELQPSRLWALRKPIFGLGSAQILLSAIPIGGVAFALGQPLATAVLIGLVLALSSTAFALQTLAEKGQLTAHHGRAAFAILLMQDLAVIPLLAMIPLLAPGAGNGFEPMALAKTLGVIALVIIGGRTLLRPVMRAVASAHTNEIFTAMALLVVVGTALLMQWVGLSMALGAFLAGVLLADSEYRHALEADIEPFKGLLLGLFFIAVGMGVNLGLLASAPLQVAGIVVGLMAVKFAVLWVLGRWHGLPGTAPRGLAVALSQGGEFAFVLFGVAVGDGLMPADVSELLIVAVTVSMAITPLLFLLHERLPTIDTPAPQAFDTPEHHRVIIAGFGRFGQIVARVLQARKEPFTALELDPQQVDFVRRFGNKTFFGDASRPELLRAAQIEHADLFVLAIQEDAQSLAVARAVRELAPDLRIIARARNRAHAYKLMELGIRDVVRDTLWSSAHAAETALAGLGYTAAQARDTVERFVELDETRLFDSFGKHDNLEAMIDMARASASELEAMFEQDNAETSRERKS